MTKVLAFVQSIVTTVLAKPIDKIVNDLGGSPALAAVVKHVVVVFLGGLVVQLYASHSGTLVDVARAAVAAGAVAVVHYFLGLVPSAAAKKQ